MTKRPLSLALAAFASCVIFTAARAQQTTPAETPITPAPAPASATTEPAAPVPSANPAEAALAPAADAAPVAETSPAAPAVEFVAPPGTSPTAPATTTTTAPAAPAEAAAAAPVAAKGKDSAGRDTLSVDFPDEDVRNILRNVADLFELNIIMPETLQGKTTIKLRDVTWRQIFQSVLDPVGYTYIEDGNIIKIVSKELLNEEPVTTEVFVVNYARAADILPTISSLVDPAKGKIVVDARSNSLVITERPTRLSRVRPIIEQLDRATDQVMIESKFVEVTDQDIKNIGVNWTSLAGYGIGAGPFNGSYERSRGQQRNVGSDATSSNGTNNTTSNTVSNNTTNTNGQTMGSTTNNTVTSTNGTPTSASTTGTSGSTTNGTNTTGTTGSSTVAGSTTGSAIDFFNSIANTGSTGRGVSAVFSADEFSLVLSALKTQSEVKIVSNPTVVTLNNTEATINVGDSQPIPNYAFNQQTGSFEVNGFTYKDIGIILKVTPQVNARGFIKLTLAPEVSQENGVRRFGEAELPIIATRKAVTQVSLKDGYTMGIGGLLTTQTTNGQTKVPILGSIPVAGRLFRSDSKNHRVTNLIIFITAKTMSADGAPVEQVFESSRVRQLELRREDLPGYRDGTSPFVPSEPPAEKKSAATRKAKSASAK